MTSNDKTTILISKDTRDRLAKFCGRDYSGAGADKTYDEALIELLDLYERVHPNTDKTEVGDNDQAIHNKRQK